MVVPLQSFSVIFLDACTTLVVPLMCSFRILSLLVTPHIHLSILISFTSSRTRYSNIFSNSARCSSHRPARSAWMHRSRIITISMYISHSCVVGDVHVLSNSAIVNWVTSSKINAEVFSTLFVTRHLWVAGQWKQSLTWIPCPVSMNRDPCTIGCAWNIA